MAIFLSTFSESMGFLHPADGGLNGCDFLRRRARCARDRCLALSLLLLGAAQAVPGCVNHQEGGTPAALTMPRAAGGRSMVLGTLFLGEDGAHARGRALLRSQLRIPPLTRSVQPEDAAAHRRRAVERGSGPGHGSGRRARASCWKLLLLLETEFTSTSGGSRTASTLPRSTPPAPLSDPRRHSPLGKFFHGPGVPHGGSRCGAYNRV